MSRTIKHTPRSGGGRPVDVAVPPEQRRYVALRHLKLGGGWLEPGDPVPVEPGRNYDMLLRHGHIQAVIEPTRGKRAKA